MQLRGKIYANFMESCVHFQTDNISQSFWQQCYTEQHFLNPKFYFMLFNSLLVKRNQWNIAWHFPYPLRINNGQYLVQYHGLHFSYFWKRKRGMLEEPWQKFIVSEQNCKLATCQYLRNSKDKLLKVSLRVKLVFMRHVVNYVNVNSSGKSNSSNVQEILFTICEKWLHTTVVLIYRYKVSFQLPKYKARPTTTVITHSNLTFIFSTYSQGVFWLIK